jgi:hypothetical protein
MSRKASSVKMTTRSPCARRIVTMAAHNLSRWVFQEIAGNTGNTVTRNTVTRASMPNWDEGDFGRVAPPVPSPIACSPRPPREPRPKPSFLSAPVNGVVSP